MENIVLIEEGKDKEKRPRPLHILYSKIINLRKSGIPRSEIVNELNISKKVVNEICADVIVEKNKFRGSLRSFRINNKEKENKFSNKYQMGKERHERNKYLKNKYGITLEEYEKMFQDQKGRCKICGILQSNLVLPLSVDHNHKNGKIRGLLCNNCNSILGHADDNIIILENSIKYLLEYKRGRKQ